MTKALGKLRDTRALRRSGFVTITAIVLIGLTSITIAALASRFALDIQRTRSMSDEAQLRQLLLVATHIPPPQPGKVTDVSLPQSLVQSGTYVHVQSTPAKSGEITVHVEARFNGHIARETLVYHLSAAGPVLDQAHLDQ